jgi:hypothetical protein
MTKPDMPLTTPQVIRRDRMLILTLPDAINPVIWQMDVTHVRTAALGVVAHADRWQIRCRNDDGTTQDVALYDDRDRAMHVLALVHAVLTDDIQDDRSGKKNISDMPKPRHLTLATLSVLMFSGVMVVLIQLVPPLGVSSGPRTVGVQEPLSQIAPAAAAPSAPFVPGEPVRADDVLQNRGGTP